MVRKKSAIGRYSKHAKRNREKRKKQELLFQTAVEKHKQEWTSEVQKEIKKLRKGNVSDHEDEDTPPSSIVKTEIKNEPMFESVFECVSVQPENKLFVDFLRPEQGDEILSLDEMEKLNRLQNKIDLLRKELNLERNRGTKLEEELEAVNNRLKDVGKLYGFGMDCF